MKQKKRNLQPRALRGMLHLKAGQELTAWLWAVFLLPCLVTGNGCKSSAPEGTNPASGVVIEGYTVSEIRRAAISVFVKEGYELRQSFGREAMFEKRAGAMSDLAYGGWLSSKTWMRVKLKIEDHKPGGSLVTCDEYVVSGRGDAVFEEEQKPVSRHRGYYRKLLEEVKADLGKQP
jgi:hypothetical protein